MSGKNVSVLELPPGIFSDYTQYASGKHWYDGNLVRWFGSIMVPVGGWRAVADFGAAPVVTALTVPAGQLTDVAAGASYTFSAVNLGASVIKRSLVGVSCRYNAAPGVGGYPVLTVNGQSCTLVSFSTANTLQFTGWYMTSDAVTVSVGAIVALNNAATATILHLGIFPYEYLGPAGPYTNARASSTGLSATTQALVVPPKSVGLAIGAVNATDPIIWNWSGSTVDNTQLLEANDTSITRNIPENLNSINSTITQSGLVSASRETNAITLPQVVGVEPVRDMLSWRDSLKNPWVAAGSSDRLWGLIFNDDSTYTQYLITPATLAWNPGGAVGYGSGAFGEGPYGIDGGETAVDAKAQWSMDNFGKLLIAVHSQDGRLFSWDPVTPNTVAVPVLNAPVDNTLCIMTNEEFCMVLGGKNNPRRVKWASQRTLTDWTPLETNSAGGFDLQSHGTIIGAVKVPEGILVITDADIHLIQYIGAPNFYGRRKISEDGSLVGKNALTPFPNGAMWMGHSDFWLYVGGNVVRMPCTVHTEAFYQSELSQPQNVFLGVNEFAGEIWAFFPAKGGTYPTNYVMFSFAKENYWSKGQLTRTAWLNPTWQPKPLAARDQTLYEHEYGALDNGVPRVGIFAETGAMEIGEGDEVMRVDRIYQDAGIAQAGSFTISDPLAFSATFKLRQAPNAPQHTYGPVSLGDSRGYTTVRFRARQVSMRIDQTKDEIWTLGKLRLRLKPGGRR